MKVVALVSGGKDSCYAIYLAQQQGHEVVALANLLPQPHQPDELDSYMFQTVGHQLVEAYAECMSLPLYRRYISGTSAQQDMQYTKTEGDEVEDLYCLLAYVKECMPGVTAVTSGAIASDYQRLRVEHVCSRLNLVSLSYLWHQPQRDLLRGMIDSGVHAILVKVAALGLSPHKHLGRSLAQLEPHFHKLNLLYGSNVCGEGGEYESLTLDAPIFTHGHIVLDKTEVLVQSEDCMAPVGYLNPLVFHVERKQPTLSSNGVQAPPDISSTNVQATGTVPPMSESSSSHCVQPGVYMVPEQYTPGPRPLASLDCTLLKQEPGAFQISVTVHQQQDYIQVTCRAARNPHSTLPGASAITEQETVQAIMELLTALRLKLGNAGLHLGQALFVHLYLANMAHFAAANAVYCQHMPGLDPPSRACVQLPLPHDMPVAIDVLLARHSLSDTTPCAMTRGQRKVLHVQSISSWAPSCIGPYSQACAYQGLVHLAGSIPLQPASMTVLPGDVAAQTLCALANVQAVAVAMRSCVLRAALGTIVYYNTSIGTAGRAVVQATLRGVQEQGLPKQSQNSASEDSISATANQAEDDRAQEDEGAEGEEAPVDTYLQPPQIDYTVHGHVVYLAVPALPRGCLVEMQPLALDTQWLEQQLAARKAVSTPPSPRSPSPGLALHPPLSAEPTEAAAGGSISTAAGTATAAAGGSVSATAASAPPAAGESDSAAAATAPPAILSKIPPPDFHTQTGTYSLLAQTVQQLSGLTTAPRLCSPNTDSCQESVRCTVDREVGKPASVGSLDQGPGSCAVPAFGDEVMISTVWFQQYPILKALFHLPAEVFAQPNLKQRLQRAVQDILGGYGLQLTDVVQSRGWYDESQVAPAATRHLVGSEPSAEVEEPADEAAWHMSWVPVLGVSTCVCPEGVAGVMEVLAMSTATVLSPC